MEKRWNQGKDDLLCRFIGEESVAGGEKCELTDNPTWIIDPIGQNQLFLSFLVLSSFFFLTHFLNPPDGTTNFVHSNPQICTILGFMVNKV